MIKAINKIKVNKKNNFSLGHIFMTSYPNKNSNSKYFECKLTWFRVARSSLYPPPCERSFYSLERAAPTDGLTTCTVITPLRSHPSYPYNPCTRAAAPRRRWICNHRPASLGKPPWNAHLHCGKRWADVHKSGDVGR